MQVARKNNQNYNRYRNENRTKTQKNRKGQENIEQRKRCAQGGGRLGI